MSRNKSVNLDALMLRIEAEGAKCLLTRGEAAALIANRVMDKHDSARGARNRIAMQLARGTANGFDVTAGGINPSPDGRYTVDEIRRWATRRFGARFEDLPFEARVFKATLRDGFAMSSGTSFVRLPGSLDESHATILDLRAQLATALANFRETERARAASTYARLGRK